MPQLVPVNHNLLHQDTIANEFNDILGLSTLFSGLITSWAKRKKITITGSTDGILTDYQIKIFVHRTADTDSGVNVYLNGECNESFSDIHFKDSSGNDLSYWLETRSIQTAIPAATDNRAIFWVKIPSIPASPSTLDIYIYYGATSAISASNGANTFILFDDFDQASGITTDVDIDNFDCLELDPAIGTRELLTQSGMKEIGNVIYEPADTGKEYKMAYSAGSALLTAYSSDGKNWTKYSETGLISGVEDPWIFAEGGTYYCYGEIKSGGNTDDLGLWTATDMGGPWSFDSVMITKAVVAGWRDSIVGSPVVWKESSTYYMNYEGVGTGSPKNGQGLATASSPDGPWTEQNTDTVPMTGFEKASGRYAWNGDVISDDHRKIDSTYYCPMHSGVQVKSQPEFPYGTLLGLYKSTDAVSGSMVWSEDPRSPIVWPDLNNSEHFQVFPIDSELYALTYADEWEPEPLGIKLAKFVQANESGIDTDIWDYGHKGQTGRIGVAGGNAVIDVYDSPAGGNGCCTYFQTKTAALPAADFAVLFRVHNPNATMAVSVGTNNTVQGSSGGASLWYDTRLGDGYSAKWYTSYRNRVYKTANAGAQTQVGAEWVGKDHNYNTWMPGTELVYLADGTIEWTVEGVTQYTDLDATYVSGAKYLQFAMGNYSDGRSDGFRILIDYIAVAKRTANEPAFTWGIEENL